MDFEKVCKMGWIGKACHDVGLWKRVTDWDLYALCNLHVFLHVVANAYTCKALWVIGMDQTPREVVFLWESRFRLPALQSALLCKAQVDPPWCTCKCTDAWRSVGAIKWFSNNNRQDYWWCIAAVFLPASPKAKAGLGVQSLRPSVRPSVCPSVRPSVCPSVRPSVRPSVPKSCHRNSSETTNPIIMKLGM